MVFSPDRHAAGAAARWQRLAIAAVAALGLLEELWELWLAPLKPGGSWLALKALPIALLWPRLSRGDAKAGQWLALLLPLYFAEAIIRALTEGGRHRLLAVAATALAGMAFVAVLASFRAARRDRAAPH
jgi:uncharacterized membrane protein